MPVISSLAYKPNFQDVLRRMQSLYSREAGHRIFATMSVPNAALENFARTHSHSRCEYPDISERTRFWDDYYRLLAEVEDDSMPAAYLSEFDQGLYGGLLNGEV
ncbi:MAG: hypothetical protein ACWGMZ_02650, partial [Thermoguttaceae bacterium]